MRDTDKVGRPGESVGGLSTRQLGAYGERLAERYLRERGLTVLDRNWRCEWGELDLVLRDGATVVFCEVKTRRSRGFGDPVESVTVQKVARLRRLAAAWLAQHEERFARVRIDVVGVVSRPGSTAQVRHLEGVGS